jgi:phosphoglycolate phosphatase
LDKALTTSAREAHPETRLLIVGDTPFDGIAAKAAGIPFPAVCTGKYDRSAFQDSEAIAVIDTLAEGNETILEAIWCEAVWGS